MRIEDANAECVRITQREAKNFSYGIRLLPGPKRHAMSALYAYARRIDDIADGSSPVDTKLRALDAIDAQIDVLALGDLPDPDDAVLVGLSHAASTFEVPVIAFREIVEGCRDDARGVRFHTAADTERYCRLVAGSVGRLSLGVFGSSDGAIAQQHADDLGVALQLTNILRDIVEDREMGRVYLPSEELQRFGCHSDLSGPGAAVAELVVHYVGVTEGFYARGLQLLPMLDRRSRSCVAAMAGIYGQLLAKISEAPTAVLAGRVSLSTREKMWVAARSLAGAPP